MENILKQELFSRGILVSEEDDLSPADAFSAAVALGQEFAIRIKKGIEHANKGVIKDAALFFGKYVPEPFYRGFPDSVRELTPHQKFYDQCYSYAMTYGLGFFEDPSHSIFEKEVKRTLFKENVEPKDFVIVKEDEAKSILLEILTGYLNMSRPLNQDQYAMIGMATERYGLDFIPDFLPCKETAIKLIVWTNNLKFARSLELSDTIKLVEYLITSYRTEYVVPHMKINKLNLKNADRKLIAKVIHAAFINNKTDVSNCFTRRKEWCGLLHHIHFKPENQGEEAFARMIRDPKQVNLSVESQFEDFMSKGKVAQAACWLSEMKGTGALVRSLNYILSRCKTDDEIKEVLSCLK